METRYFWNAIHPTIFLTQIGDIRLILVNEPIVFDCALQNAREDSDFALTLCLNRRGSHIFSIEFLCLKPPSRKIDC